jgi:hypothetical protein
MNKTMFAGSRPDELTRLIGVDFGKIERERALPIVTGVLRSVPFRDRLLIEIYEAAVDQAPLLSERGIRDALDALIGPKEGADAGLTTGPCGLIEGVSAEAASPPPPAPNGAGEVTDLRRKRGPKPAKRRGAEEAVRLGRGLLKGLTDPDLYAMVTARGAAVARVDRATGRLTLLKGAQVPVSGTLTYPGIREAIAHLRSRPDAILEEGGVLILRQPVEVLSATFANILITGHNSMKQRWTDHKGEPLVLETQTGRKGRFANGLILQFPDEAVTAQDESAKITNGETA